MTRQNYLDQWWRLGGAAGIIYVVLFIVGILIQGDTPMPNKTANEIRDYFVDNDTAYMIGDFIIGIAFIFFLMPFASALRSFLGRAEGPAAMWSRLTFAGALLFTAAGAATSGTFGALAYDKAQFADDNLLKLIVDGNYYTFTIIAPFVLTLMVLPASLVILRTNVLWPLLGWFGIVVSVALVISALAILNDDPTSALGLVGIFAFLSAGIWIIATGVGMWMRTAPPEMMSEGMTMASR